MHFHEGINLAYPGLMQGHEVCRAANHPFGTKVAISAISIRPTFPLIPGLGILNLEANFKHILRQLFPLSSPTSLKRGARKPPKKLSGPKVLHTDLNRLHPLQKAHPRRFGCARHGKSTLYKNQSQAICFAYYPPQPDNRLIRETCFLCKHFFLFFFFFFFFIFLGGFCY